MKNHIVNLKKQQQQHFVTNFENSFRFTVLFFQMYNCIFTISIIITMCMFEFKTVFKFSI